MMAPQRRHNRPERNGASRSSPAPADASPRAALPDRAPDLPGRQLNDPDETAAAGVHRQPIFPQRRGGGPR